MLNDRVKFVIPDAKKQDLKSTQLANSGNTFAAMAAALANPGQIPEHNADTIADSKTSDTSAETVQSAVTGPTSSIKTRLASFTSARKKPADEVKHEEKEKSVSSKQKLQLSYHDVKQINKRLNIYIEYLTAIKIKSNPSDRSAIQRKIDIATKLVINKSDQANFNKFTDADGFSATVKQITEHRNKSIFNKYIQSEGSKLVADIEVLLPPCYESELKFRRLRQLLEKYKTHLDDAFFQSQILENKKKVVNALLDLLNFKIDSDPREALELFQAKWRTSITEIVRHRNKLFEVASVKSEGQALEENIEKILRTIKQHPNDYLRSSND